MFRELCPSLIQVRRMSAGLAEKIRDAQKRLTPEELRQLFTRAEATPFLRGEGERGWNASLLWVLENAQEIAAGRYDSYEKPKTPEAPEDWAEKWKDWNRLTPGREGDTV